MFAKQYLQQQKNGRLILQPPHVNVEIIVVIPCFYEPDIVQTLESLKTCNWPGHKVEVIVLINHSEIAGKEVQQQNRKTKTELDKWIANNKNEQIQFFAVGPVALKKKWAGAGLARKSGMDEAVLRFQQINKPGGIIVSLDADTLVAENYLVEIEKYFAENPKIVGATIAFQHQTEGLAPKHLQGIRLYEKYMVYYKKAIGFTGYPFPMFTVGSAFAVTAAAYVKRGGMNRRQAGEDFYFLQNLVQLGKVGEITTTRVFPSARLSDRVPFGTGPILRKWMNDEEDLTLTFHFQAFADLKKFFDICEKLYKVTKEEYEQLVSEMPSPVAEFLQKDNFWEELNDVNQNCAIMKTFQTRFFQKFNAFKILKFLNFVHEHFYEKASLDEQVDSLEKTIH
ncbi:MAG TPA: glycosyltransferase family 2 protein [Draconibacterium sp.]|nr:glycosyltransferase family 2 protein [Draconibacterium sp.]